MCARITFKTVDTAALSSKYITASWSTSHQILFQIQFGHIGMYDSRLIDARSEHLYTWIDKRNLNRWTHRLNAVNTLHQHPTLKYFGTFPNASLTISYKSCASSIYVPTGVTSDHNHAKSRYSLIYTPKDAPIDNPCYFIYKGSPTISVRQRLSSLPRQTLFLVGHWTGTNR